MNSGCPPTARNARTGLFTPPGIKRSARSISLLDALCPLLCDMRSFLTFSCGPCVSGKWGYTIPLSVVILDACAVYDPSLLATSPVVQGGAGGTAGESAELAQPGGGAAGTASLSRAY